VVVTETADSWRSPTRERRGSVQLGRVRPKRYGLSILSGFSDLAELKDIADLFQQYVAYFGGGREEELLPCIGSVERTGCEVTMKFSF
jgi:hypothetical protein